MLSRKYFIDLEEKNLAPYAAKAGKSLGRFYSEQEHPYRTCFQRDRDRIIHSTAFRRLQYKTQVFVNHEGDHYRTRLTHTLETYQIARTLATMLRLNTDLVEAIALSHDLGHPPFGHAGEEQLKECMKEHGGFEHNLQTLRVVEMFEQRYPEFTGLNLSFEVLESIRKHTILAEYPVEEKYKPQWRPLLEAQIVNEADSIAYTTHDVEDGLRAGLIELRDIQNLKIWQDIIKNLPPHKIEEEILIKQFVRLVIEQLVSDLVSTTLERVKKFNIDSIEAVRNADEQIVSFSEETKEKKQELEQFLKDRVYRHYKVVIMCQKAKRFVRELFDEYTKHPEQLPPKYYSWIERFGVYRVVADYIAGMTDRYAQQEYKKLFYPFEKV